jgi:hypothetical protein
MGLLKSADSEMPGGNIKDVVWEHVTYMEFQCVNEVKKIHELTSLSVSLTAKFWRDNNL